MKTAIVLGASGLTGRSLTELLLEDDGYECVKTFSRSSLDFKHTKMEAHVVDFERPEFWRGDVRGDVLYSALGTTLRKAGSKIAQYKVDYTYQFRFAETAAQNGVPTYVLVSAAGANATSPFFYMRVKGELEKDVLRLPFKRKHIFRPGLLAGVRKESRPFERLGLSVVQAFNKVGLLKGSRPIDVRDLARAMRNAVDKKDLFGVYIYALEDIFQLCEK